MNIFHVNAQLARPDSGAVYRRSLSDSAHDGKQIPSGACPGTRPAISGASGLKALTPTIVYVTAVSLKL